MPSPRHGKWELSLSDPSSTVDQARLFDVAAVGREPVDAEFQGCSLNLMASGSNYTVAGLFAGIGGIESGLSLSGAEAELLCEYWEPAYTVLSNQFPGVPIVHDVRDLRSLPAVDLVTAGFPCTDLSQAGRMSGIRGAQSGLVGEVFRLLKKPRAPMLLLENVKNMLVLDGGRAMRYLVDELERLGYRWAYRLVDSRFSGVPQRRQRVIFLAALDVDPRAILFADDAGERPPGHYSDEAFGFYWTEGLRGLGWAQDAVPTLKGGSTIGIASPPAIWRPGADLGTRIVTPPIEGAERLQGFPSGWTKSAELVSRQKGTRWKLVGNAVTTGVAEWVGRRIADPGEPILEGGAMQDGDRWPRAAFGANGKVWGVELSMWPTRERYRHLLPTSDAKRAVPLSARASAGFLERAQRGSLRFADGFLDDVADHLAFMRKELSVA